MQGGWKHRPGQIKVHNQPHYGHSRPNQKFIWGVLIPTLPSLSFLPFPPFLLLVPQCPPNPDRGFRECYYLPPAGEKTFAAPRHVP